MSLLFYFYYSLLLTLIVSENEILGWQLLAICAGTFLPTKELMSYLRVHFQEGCKNKVSMEASLLSALALRKLQVIIILIVITIHCFTQSLV